jgi:hypothetical protein
LIAVAIDTDNGLPALKTRVTSLAPAKMQVQALVQVQMRERRTVPAVNEKLDEGPQCGLEVAVQRLPGRRHVVPNHLPSRHFPSRMKHIMRENDLFG